MFSGPVNVSAKQQWLQTLMILSCPFVGRLTRMSHLFFPSSMLASTEYVQQLALVCNSASGRWFLLAFEETWETETTACCQFTRGTCYELGLVVLKWRRCLENKTLLSKSSFSFPLVSLLPHQTPLDLVWHPEVCGEQQRVIMLQWAHTDWTWGGALPIQTQV